MSLCGWADHFAGPSRSASGGGSKRVAPSDPAAGASFGVPGASSYVWIALFRNAGSATGLKAAAPCLAAVLEAHVPVGGKGAVGKWVALVGRLTPVRLGLKPRRG